MMFHMVVLFLERANRAVNAVAARSVARGRLIIASQQLQECRQQNDPRSPQNSWLPGMQSQNLMWQVDPCEEQQKAMDELIQQSAQGQNRVATAQVGGAPVPQLAESTDSVTNTDPAIPMNEWDTPDPQGPENNWLDAPDPYELWDEIMQEMRDQDLADSMEEDILQVMLHYQEWCPWGGPSEKRKKWFWYKPIISAWITRWKP